MFLIRYLQFFLTNFKLVICLTMKMVKAKWSISPSVCLSTIFWLSIQLRAFKYLLERRWQMKLCKFVNETIKTFLTFPLHSAKDESINLVHSLVHILFDCETCFCFLSNFKEDFSDEGSSLSGYLKII